MFRGTAFSYSAQQKNVIAEAAPEYPKLTTAKLALHYGKTTSEVFAILVKKGCLTITNDGFELTEKGKDKAGGEKKRGRYGSYYFLWNNPSAKK
ncbi:MAG: hypothetical protein D3914_01400 [Candidatus Electrothrix sp. LOE2]|jgi:hypothetical protein|nr:hypothetical protein [Candidatus Electrothrix sp. LOE2]